MKRWFNDQGKRILMISLVAIVLWCSLIFYLSSRNGKESSAQSKSISAFIVRAIDGMDGKMASEQTILQKATQLDHTIRDLGHSSEYLILGVLLFWHIGQRKIPKLNAALMAFGFALVYAISDELHQLYVPGRACDILDLLADSIGMTIGILGFWLVSSQRARIKTKKDKGRS